MTTAHQARPSPRWIPPPPDTAARAANLSALLPVLPGPLSLVLAARGLTDPPSVRRFLRPTLDELHDPFGLPDLASAVDCLEAALGRRHTIFVHGDFDADGMSATALAVGGLRRLGGEVVPYVPHRTIDGYDLREEGVERAAEAGAALILTVDCGVTAVEAVSAANDRGIEVIVTDHHRPGPELPAAAAVVNPMRDDSVYPCRGLAGVGVAFKLISALYARAGIPDGELYQHLDLVAVGTVADQMPLTGENRVLVRAGLRALAHTRKPGLRALLRRAKIDARRPISADDIAFGLAPRLNSVGRMAAAETGVRLLLTDDPANAEALAAHLDEQNAARRRTDRDVTAEVERVLDQRFDAASQPAVVVWGDDWHRGVVGIVASRIVERWRRPAVVVSFDGEQGEGSGRSVEGFHLVEALRECGSLLEGFGGHSMAAGLRIRREKIEEFAARLRDLAAVRLEGVPATPELPIDLELPLASVDGDLFDALRHLAPHGTDNPRPVLAVRGVRLERLSAVGPKGAHLQAMLRDANAGLRAIGFGFGDRLSDFSGGRRFDAAFHLERDFWRGRERLQARLLDVRPSQE